MRMKRLFLPCFRGVLISVVTPPARAAAPACDPDNGGLKLPQGFCAAVVADNSGRARHLVVAPNGDVFVSTETGRGGTGGGVSPCATPTATASSTSASSSARAA